MKSTKLFLPILCLLIGLQQVNAQNEVDSLKQLLTTSGESTKTHTLLQLANAYRGRDNDSTIYYSKEAFERSYKLNNDTLQAIAKNVEGTGYFRKSEYKKALKAFSIALETFKLLEDSIQMGSVLKNMGTCLAYQGKYEEAIEVLFQARTIQAAINDPKLSSTINNLGLVYYKISDYDRALDYYLQAAKLKKKHNQKRSLSNTLNNIGIIYRIQEKYDSAVIFYNRSLQIAIDFNDLSKQANAHNNLAIIYEKNGEFNKAETSYYKSIKLKIQLGDQLGLLNTYKNLSNLFLLQHKVDRAKKMISLADSLMTVVGEDNFVSYSLLLTKAEYYKATNNFEEALEYTNRALNKRVSEINEDRNQKIAQWEVKFETTQKEAEIEKLELESVVQQLQLSKAKNQLIGIIIIIALLMVLLTVVFTFRRKKLKAEKIEQELQLEALKQRLMTIEMENKSLTPEYHLNDINTKLHTPLTEREIEALKLSLGGLSNQEIADQLFVSINTVKFHLRNIYQKLGVNNKKEVFEYVAKSS